MEARTAMLHATKYEPIDWFKWSSLTLTLLAVAYFGFSLQ